MAFGLLDFLANAVADIYLLLLLILLLIISGAIPFFFG